MPWVGDELRRKNKWQTGKYILEGIPLFSLKLDREDKWTFPVYSSFWFYLFIYFTWIINIFCWCFVSIAVGENQHKMKQKETGSIYILL